MIGDSSEGSLLARCQHHYSDRRQDTASVMKKSHREVHLIGFDISFSVEQSLTMQEKRQREVVTQLSCGSCTTTLFGCHGVSSLGTPPRTGNVDGRTLLGGPRKSNATRIVVVIKHKPKLPCKELDVCRDIREQNDWYVAHPIFGVGEGGGSPDFWTYRG